MPKQPAPAFDFAGFSNPNTTPVPDVVFDELLLRLDNNELRVLLYIVRRTYGFKKHNDNISLSQMVSGLRRKDGTVLDYGTGLSKASVARGLKGLIDKHIIVSRRNRSEARGDQSTTYALRLKEEVSEPDGGEGDSSDDPCLSVETGGVSEMNTPVSQSGDTQETVLQQTDLSNIRTAEPEKDETDEKVSQQHIPEAPVGERPESSGRGGNPKGMAELLKTYQPRFKVGSTTDRDERTAIASYIGAFAPEFGDKAPVKSSVSRAYNLFKQSSLALPAFVAELYTARSSVKEIAAKKHIQNRMSYFFGLLEDQLGLTTPKTNQELAR